MSQIITVSQTTIGNNTIQTVNARELHEYLGVGKQFSHWIQDRIDMYDFQENVDFCILKPNLANIVGRPSQNYYVSLDMAKELSMVDRGEKGKQARKYFLECEKKMNAPLNLDDPSQLRGILLGYTEKVLELQAKIEVDKPKVDYYNCVTDAENTVDMTQVAKSLGLGRNELFKQLRLRGVLCKDNLPMQKYLNAKWFKVVTQEYNTNGEQRFSKKTVVYGKGEAGIHKLLNN
jgi:anti-repressor protein